MNQPYYDPNDPNQQPYDPNQQPGQPQYGGYVRVQPEKKQKAGDKYKGSGKKVKGKKGKNQPGSGAAMMNTIGTWLIGLGLPALLIYFMITKLFVEKIEVQMDPYPPVKLSPEQEKEALKFGETIATQLTEGHKDDIQRTVLWPEVTYRVSRKMQLSLSQSVTVRDEIKAKWEADVPGLFRQILGSDLDRVPTKFVKLRERDGYPCALIRTMPVEGRVNYYDLLLVPAKGTNKLLPEEEKLMVVDIWDCNRAGYSSDAIRREVILNLPTDNDHNLPWRSVYGENRTKEEILAIKVLIPSDVLNRPQALDDIAALPEELRKSQEMYSIAVKAYQKIFNGIISSAQLDKFKALLAAPPDAGSGAVVTGTMLAEIEKRSDNKAGVEPALLKAYQEIGKDPYLKVLVAELRLAAGDLAGAEAMAAEVQRENRNLVELIVLKNELEKKRTSN